MKNAAAVARLQNWLNVAPFVAPPSVCPRLLFLIWLYLFVFIGERGGNRTHDPLIKSQMLYLLSYALVPNRACGVVLQPWRERVNGD